MVLMPINPKKVKVGRKYYCCDGSSCLDCEIVAIYKNGYKIRDTNTSRLLPKLRQATDLMLRRPNSRVFEVNPRER